MGNSRLLVLVAVCLTHAVLGFRTYPLWKQCNVSWGNEQMGVVGNGERSTICGEGCAMTSLSMGLAGLGAPIDRAVADPHSFNKWLLANGGYVCLAGDCNNLVLDAVSRLNSTIELIGEKPKPSVAEIQAGLNAGDTLYIAHVHDNGHFVLLTGFDPTEPAVFTVNDAFYNTSSYPWSNITDIIMYRVTDAASNKPAAAALAALPRSSAATANRFGSGGRASFMDLVAPMPTVGDPLAAVSVRAAAAAPVVPFPYPLYKQCDPRWADDKMVNETVCEVGCLMSSTSMALGGHNISIAGALSTPGTLNAFLRAHSGYVGDSSMDEAVVPLINPAHVQWPADGMHRTNDVPVTAVQAMLAARRPVIANVMAGKHFVLVVGWDAADNDTLLVNDPGFSRANYSYSADVVGWRLFAMESCSPSC